MVITLHDKSEIESFLQQNVFLHIYSLGDLDDFFWNYTTWYALKEAAELKAIILMYTGLSLPTLLALADDIAALKALLSSVVHLLPRRFYAHLSPGLEDIINESFHLESYGEHYKMGLKDMSSLETLDVSMVAPLRVDDLAMITKLYELSYPGNWFDPRMLETGQYFGIKDGDELLSIAGIHVYSPRYKVAALGNITTHPNYRGVGFGKAVTAKLCLALSETVEHIGLNVKKDNRRAVSLYKKLDFEEVGLYSEYMVEAIA